MEKILAGGAFNAIGNQPRNLFGRLTNDTAAMQQLALTQNSIGWACSGSTAQFTRVTFEYSADNVNYSLLDNGTAAGSNWSPVGLSLPIGQNFYLRARGYSHGGQENGSKSFAESVRNALLPGIAITRSGDDIIVTYDAIATKTYRLERKLDFTAATWDPIGRLGDQTLVATGRAQITDPGGANQSKAFYRVRLLP